MRKKLCFVCLAAGCLAAFAPSTAVLAAPLSYTGGVISNNFDGLPTNVTNASQTIPGKGPHEFSLVAAATGMDGWQLANPDGSSADTEFKSQNGSLAGSTGRGVVSFGTSGSTERALGGLATSNQISTFGLVLVNNSASTYSEFTLTYTGEQWRRGNVAAPNSLLFAYGLAGGIGGSLTNAPSLNFVGPNTQASPTEVALDGNLPANQALVSDTITGLNWAPGQTLVLRWSVVDQMGQDDAVAIDNLSFSAAVPEPSAIALAATALLGAICFVRRRS